MFSCEFYQVFKNNFFHETTPVAAPVIAFAFNVKSFAIVFLVFFSSFPSRQFFGRIAGNFLANVLTLVIKKACDQDLIHSLDTPRNISVKPFTQVVIRDGCGTWQGLCTVTSIHSIQESTLKLFNKSFHQKDLSWITL